MNSTILSKSLREARLAGEKTTTSHLRVSARQAAKIPMLRTGWQGRDSMSVPPSLALGIRLTEEALKGPLLRVHCAPGTGQIYKFVPLFATKDNGYVGRNETTLLRRIQGHKTPNSECRGLRNAIQSHGLDQFAIVVLEDNTPNDQLAAAELRLIAKHDTYHNGYNGTPGGEVPPMSVPEVVAKAKATKNTAASRAKTVAAARRHWDDEEEHRKHAAALAKSRKEPAVRKKASAASKTLWKKEGYKERLSDIHKKSPLAKKHLAEMTATSKAQWSDPEKRAKRSQAIKDGRARAKAARGGVTKYVRRYL